MIRKHSTQELEGCKAIHKLPRSSHYYSVLVQATEENATKSGDSPKRCRELPRYDLSRGSTLCHLHHMPRKILPVSQNERRNFALAGKLSPMFWICYGNHDTQEPSLPFSLLEKRLANLRIFMNIQQISEDAICLSFQGAPGFRWTVPHLVGAKHMTFATMQKPHHLFQHKDE